MYHDIAKEVERLADDFGIDRKRSIGEVAEELSIEPRIIKLWEEKFPQIKPEHEKGKRRYYYNKQLKILKKIKFFLNEEGYKIEDLQVFFNEKDIDIVVQNDIKNLDNLDDFCLKEKIDKDIDNQVVSEKPNNNFIANIGQIVNINKGQEPLISKDQREELSFLFKNITKNLGDLKMLLRS